MSKKISIIGLGLIGSSIARGLCKKHEITAYNRNHDVALKAVNNGFAKKAAKTLEEAVEDADIVIVATPLNTYNSIANEMAEYLQPGVIVTDVGSVKTHAVFTFYNHMPPGVEFVPSHPIAGKEKTGYDAGEGDLFVGKKVVVTPLPKNQSESILEVENMWKDLGALPEQMTPAEHDKVYALVSHVPQLLAYAYSMAIQHKRYGIDKIEDDVNEDYKTFSRISNSDPAIWADIFMLNAVHINKFLEKFFNGILHIENFNSLVETREKLGGEERQSKVTHDSKLDAATLIFPALMGNLLLFCIEDEMENSVSRSFSPSDLHESLAIIEDQVSKKIVAKDFADYAGTGLKDFTVFGLYDVSEQVEDFEQEIQLLKALLHRKIFEITAAVESDSAEHLASVLAQAHTK